MVNLTITEKGDDILYYVIEDRVYSSVFDTINNRYPLVSVAKSAGGAITVTDEGDGISTPSGRFIRDAQLKKLLLYSA